MSAKRSEGIGPSAVGGSDANQGACDGIPVMDPGLILDRSDPAFLATAYDSYAQLRAKGPVVRTRHCPNLKDEDGAAGERSVRDVLFVGQYDAATEALVDPRLSSDPFVLLSAAARERLPPIPAEVRPIVESIIMRDPPDHTRLRKLVQPSFSPRAMDALKPRIQRIADDLIDRIEREAAERGEVTPDRQIDLVSAFAYPLPVTVISDMLGIPEADRETVNKWSELRFDSRDPEAQEKTRQTIAVFCRYLEELFERKRREPGDDMISQMVHAQEDGDRLSHDELLSMTFILYLAGHVTTVNFIGNGVVALLSHPDQLAAFRADPSLVKGVVEETLRYWAPIDYFGAVRTATDGFDLAGVQIPKGAQVTVGLASANHDPQRFANPDQYNISRDDAHRHVAFGKGIHLCLGAPLARIEGQIAFETLFRRFPHLRLAVPQENLRWTGAAGMRGFQAIPLLF